ncbi:LOW QUALITY PROTEIN: uncharacterized protein Dsimw501_GD17803 [Drosophila simulans]|uniref:RING-type domain-containing protein n=1 Tax=Drosophila simulans TaxID=7240 RepID=A0A0J9R413_DROSI|nr:LOW QUALITY PROTEIN: uncharacterized protein Dsimw501_GD17803 [Drosophila simulans]
MFTQHQNPLVIHFMEQAGLPMENYGVSQQIHNTGPIPVIGPSGFSSYLRSCSPGRVPKEYYGDSDSLSSPRSIDPYMFRRSMEYSSYTESSETSSSSDSNMSSNETSTSMGYNSDSNENPPPNKRIKSESTKSVMPYNCPVCLEDVREKQPVSTNCGHIFWKACIVRDMGRICPLCGVDEPKFHRIFL